MKKREDELFDYNNCLFHCFFQHSRIHSFMVLGGEKGAEGKKNMIESARSQLTASRRQLLRVRYTPETEKAQEIMDRSQDIYRQSVELYNDTLQKPWNAIPAFFLGFRPIAEGDKL
ncbi:hypothetical protein N752_16150 [Desulforamulus aquiferis]|nr:hypothetical protein [Desulforamulus aquiferis]RYD04113.1 hypothetical protein N752_16150 [Desulforamulus aquiferis]